MPTYPDAPRLDVVDDLHGRLVADPYRWLEDAPFGDPDLRATWSAQQSALLDEERAPAGAGVWWVSSASRGLVALVAARVLGCVPTVRGGAAQGRPEPTPGWARAGGGHEGGGPVLCLLPTPWLWGMGGGFRVAALAAAAATAAMPGARGLAAGSGGQARDVCVARVHPFEGCS